MRPKLKLTLFVTCVVLLTIPKQTSVAQPGSGPAAVATGQVIKVSQTAKQSFVGSLQSPRKSVVGTAVDGRVVTIEVEPGDPVGPDPKKANGHFVGQPVMQLRTGTLEIEIASAEIQLHLAQQTAKEMEASLPREIELAQANALESKARLQYSRTTYERSQRLRGSSSGSVGAISQGELELSRSQYQADLESTKATQIEFEKLKSTKEIRLLQSKLRVDASRQEVIRLNDLKTKYTIRAPFPGLVTQKLTDVGEWVTKGQPIVEVVQLNPIEMIVNVPQKEIGRLQESMGSSGDSKIDLVATIEFDGFSEPVSGIVKRVVSQADLRSRTFPVRIEIPNELTEFGYRLQPGMIGRAALSVGVEKEMLMVKKDALVLGGTRKTVFKIVKSGKEATAVSVPVTTGGSNGDWIQIVGDIQNGDQVVLMGNERLRDGQAVNVTMTSDDRPN